MQVNTLNVNYNPNVINRNNVKVESPRDTYSFLNRLVNDKDFYVDFQMNPIKIFGEYNFDTSKIVIPKDFILPSQEELRERLSYINKRKTIIYQ